MSDENKYEETCRDCRFRRFATNECHRHAPIATGGMMSEVQTIWPVITQDNWCGDFVNFFPLACGLG